MGSNRPHSQDSREFGPIDEDSILGRAWLRYFPLERIGLIERPGGGEVLADLLWIAAPAPACPAAAFGVGTVASVSGVEP